MAGMGCRGFSLFVEDFWAFPHAGKQKPTGLAFREQELHMERNEEVLARRKSHCPDAATNQGAWALVVVRLTFLPVLVSSLLKWKAPRPLPEQVL